MKQDIRIIGLDLDATVLNEKKQITPRVRQAIIDAGRAGILVLPATGRTITGIPREFLDIPGVRYAVTSNGAKVYELPSRKELHSDCFDIPAALALIAASDATGAYTSTYIDGEGYSPHMDFERLARLMSAEYLDYLRSSRTAVDDLPAFVEKNGRPVEKLALVYADLAQRDAAWDALSARDDCVVTTSLPFNWELNTPTADKGEGLLALGRLLGFGREQIMAMGDGLNDVEMLRKVGYGVAMGNAAPAVKAVADEVTASCEEDGVAVVIERLLAR